MSKFNVPGAGAWPEGDGYADSMWEQRWRRVLRISRGPVDAHPLQVSWYRQMTMGHRAWVPGGMYTPDFAGDGFLFEVKPYCMSEQDTLAYMDRAVSIPGGIVFLGNMGQTARFGRVPARMFGAAYVRGRPTVAMLAPWSLAPGLSSTGIAVAKVSPTGLRFTPTWSAQAIADAFHSGKLPPALWKNFGLGMQLELMEKYKGWRPQYPPEAA